jgi:hypothetical protein
MYKDWNQLAASDYNIGTDEQLGGITEVDYFSCNSDVTSTHISTYPTFSVGVRLTTLLAAKPLLSPIPRLFVKSALTSEKVASRYETRVLNADYKSKYTLHNGEEWTATCLSQKAVRCDTTRDANNITSCHVEKTSQCTQVQTICVYPATPCPTHGQFEVDGVMQNLPATDLGCHPRLPIIKSKAAWCLGAVSLL